MTLPRINIGQYSGDKDADTIREGFKKVNIAFDILDGNVTNKEVKATNFTPENGKMYLVDTTNGNVVITLPANPSEGFVFEVIDHIGYWNTNNVFVDPVSNKINGVSGILSLIDNFGHVRFRWIGYNIGWLMDT